MADYNKFYPINNDGCLAVALESSIGNMPIEECLKEKMMEKEVIIFSGKNGERRIYHPAENNKDSIIFKPVTVREKFKRLVFRAKNCWAIAGRFGEEKPFGFEKTRRRSPALDYISLAFPGPTGEFNKIYFIIKKGFYSIEILEVEANSAASLIVVSFANIGAGGLPHHMIKLALY
jgi:hypothetical protein